MANFEAMSPQVYYLSAIAPAVSNDFKTQHDPELILLFTWMGAATQHIAKYTTAYNKLYPASDIMIIRTDVVDLMFRPTFSLNQRLQPAVEKIAAITNKAASEGRSPRILSHSFSNGGAYALLALAKSFFATSKVKIPLTAMVLDSGPGLGNYNRSVTAIMMSVSKNPLIFWPVLALIHAALTLMANLNNIRGIHSVITGTYYELNKHKYLAATIPRAYIYSTIDKLVDWQDVQAHGQKANDAGSKVMQLKLLNSAHVAHLRADPVKYMGTVKACWDGAMASKQ